VRLLREQRLKETPQAQTCAEEAPEAAMDKRTPGTEINRVFRGEVQFTD